MKNVGPYQRSPWSDRLATPEIQDWRSLSENALISLTDALDGANDGYIKQGEQWFDADRMVKSIFVQNDQVPARERVELIRWLGGATAHTREGRSGDGVSHRLIDIVVGNLLDRWVAAGWRNVPGKQHVCWAEEMIDEMIFLRGDDFSVQEEWGQVPAGWVAGEAEMSPNAQTDFLVFLEGYQKEATLMGPRLMSGPNQMANWIANSCLLLQIMDSTTNYVDQRLVEALQMFEVLYDFGGIKHETLLQANAAADRKKLEEVAPEHNREQPLTTSRVRKI